MKILTFLTSLLVSFGVHAQQSSLIGFSAERSERQREWENVMAAVEWEVAQAQADMLIEALDRAMATLTSAADAAQRAAPDSGSGGTRGVH
jgi:hypothetical protein